MCFKQSTLIIVFFTLISNLAQAIEIDGLNSVYCENGTTTITSDSTVVFELPGCSVDALSIILDTQDNYSILYHSGNISNSYKELISSSSILILWNSAGIRAGRFSVYGQDKGLICHFEVITKCQSIADLSISKSIWDSHIRADTLLVCEKFSDNKLTLKLDDIVINYNDYSSSLGLSAFINGIEHSEYDYNNYVLQENDSIWFQINRNSNVKLGDCYYSVDSGLNTSTTPLVVQLIDNPKIASPEIISGLNDICPGNVTVLKMNDSLGTYDYEWMIVGDKYGQNKDSLIISYPEKVYIRQDRKFANFFCPALSDTIEFNYLNNCRKIVTGTVQQKIEIIGGWGPTIIYSPLSNVKVISDRGDVAYSDQNGEFSFEIDSFGLELTFMVADDDYEYFESTLNLQSNRVFLYSKLILDKDLELNYSTGRFRPGFGVANWLAIDNQGKDSLWTSLTVILDEKITFVSELNSIMPVRSSGDSLFWDSLFIPSGESIKINFETQLSAASNLNDSIKLNGFLSINPNDQNPYNDTIALFVPITGSFDPNDKKVSYTGTANKDHISDSTKLEYKIRFQNTGNDTAFTVVVKDVISEYLDITSIDMIGASHPYSLYVKEDTLSWTFSNILLPDSNVNRAASEGFIRFEISQKNQNSIGTEILNKAFIFFDYNEPIITNETKSIIADEIITAVNENVKRLSFYPNPAGNQLTFYNSISGSFTVYNILGEPVYFENLIENRTVILPDLQPGLYFLKVIKSANEIWSAKVNIRI